MLLRCVRCRRRYVQDTETGCCRACGRAAGLYHKTKRDEDTDRLARQRARHTALGVAAADLEPRPARYVTIDGQSFEIVWDGA